MKEGTYVIPDNKGYKVGPFVCSVEYRCMVHEFRALHSP